MILLWNSADMTVHMSIIDGEYRNDMKWEAGRSLAKDMLGYLRDRLSEQNATFADVTGIGVYRGPGSYTGLRIGLTVLNTLAATESIPIVGATGNEWSSECLSRLATGENEKIVLPEYGGDANITKPRK